jgi:hypothetical protein
VSTTCDPHGCYTLNDLLVVCGPRSARVWVDRWVSRRVGGAKEWGGRRRGEVSTDRRLGEVPGWV